MTLKYRKIKKNKQFRAEFKKTELTRRYLKFMRLQIIKQPFLKLASRERDLHFWKYQKLLSKLPKNKIKNICLLTGKSRGIYRDFKIPDIK